MTPETVITVGQQALQVTVMLAGPLLLSALAVGLLIAMFQAATQINEMTLTFVPKLMTVAAVVGLAAPWFLKVLLTFTVRLYESIPELIG